MPPSISLENAREEFHRWVIQLRRLCLFLVSFCRTNLDMAFKTPKLSSGKLQTSRKGARLIDYTSCKAYVQTGCAYPALSISCVPREKRKYKVGSASLCFVHFPKAARVWSYVGPCLISTKIERLRDMNVTGPPRINKEHRALCSYSMRCAEKSRVILRVALLSLRSLPASLSLAQLHEIQHCVENTHCLSFNYSRMRIQCHPL